jgi:hypothetical protein
MKLVKQSKGSWQYHLNQNEADILRGLVKKFPFTEMIRVKISGTDKTPEAAEREHLLNESLAEHRKELKKIAGNLLTADKFKPAEKGCLLTLNSESREILLQILNDIRVGCWRAVGEPEVLESQAPNCSMQELAYRNLMDLAGYFEQGLLAPET